MRKHDFLWRSVASARQSALFPFQNQDQGSRGNRTRRCIRQSGRFLGLAAAAAMSNSPSIDVARQALRVANHFLETNRRAECPLRLGRKLYCAPTLDLMRLKAVAQFSVRQRI